MKHAAPFWNASRGCSLIVKPYEDVPQRRKKSLKLTDCSLTVLCELPGGPGFAPGLFLHSVGVFLVMATASPVPACNHSSWVKSEWRKCSGVIWDERKTLTGRAVFIRWLIFETSDLKCFPHRAGAAYRDNSPQHLDLQRKYLQNPTYPANGEGKGTTQRSYFFFH